MAKPSDRKLELEQQAARVLREHLATITDGAVQPKPWYKRWAGYVWMPVKLATIFAK